MPEGAVPGVPLRRVPVGRVGCLGNIFAGCLSDGDCELLELGSGHGVLALVGLGAAPQEDRCSLPPLQPFPKPCKEGTGEIWPPLGHITPSFQSSHPCPCRGAGPADLSEFRAREPPAAGAAAPPVNHRLL